MTKELEQCPACGNKSPSEKMSKLPNGMWMSEIECLDEAPAVAFTSMGVGETPEQAREMAVDNWNTRYKRTCKWWLEDYHDEINNIWTTECGGRFQWAEYGHPKCCPNCGAEVGQ